ncbi:MAG: pantothenate kinase [Rhodothermales bacterium]
MHRPLLAKLHSRQIAAAGGRLIVLLAGPPGAGKSTLCALWTQLARDAGWALQGLPMDGFHFSNAELAQRALLHQKGTPETYDITALLDLLSDLRAGGDTPWPRYDRSLHEPVASAIQPIREGVIVVEGNYMLLDRPGWRELRELADLSGIIRVSYPLCRERVVSRHIRGGCSPEDADAKYRRTDRHNHQLIRDHQLPADFALVAQRGRPLRCEWAAGP